MRKVSQKLNLFSKSFLITLITIISTVIVFAFGFKLLYTSYITSFLDRKFDESVKKITTEFESKSLEELLIKNEIVEWERKYNVFIVITDSDNNTIYPYMYGGIAQNAESKFNIRVSESTNSAATITDSASSRVKYFQYYNGGRKYDIQIVSNTGIDNSVFSSIFFSVLPYMMLVGLVMSAIVSYIYAKYSSKKIAHLNEIMETMETFEYIPLQEPIIGDEIADLENHIDHLYLKLIHELQIVRNFEKDRDIFMKGSIHELKTPLMIIGLHIETLIQETTLSNEQFELVSAVKTKLNHMSTLVNETLKISKLDTIQNRDVILIKPVIVEILELYNPMILDKNQTVNLSLSVDKISMNYSDFSRIISNLISNAVRYGDKKSEVEINITKEEIKISNFYSGEWVESIDILEPFTSIEKNEGSHGLGLYVVAMILKKYDYDCSYNYNNETNYFTFTFRTINEKKI